MCGIVFKKKKRVIFFNLPKSCYRCFSSYRFLRWWALSTRNVTFPASCGCDSILGRKSTSVTFSFHLPFISHSCPFIFHRYVSNIQVYERWYVQSGQVGIRPNARLFFIFRCRFCYRVAIALEACAGCHLQGSWTMNMYMYKFVIVFFYSYRFLAR